MGGKDGRTEKMVRGVNKKVIEINCTEHAVFERAILFVKPGCAEQGEQLLQHQAGDYVTSVHFDGAPPFLAKRKHRTKKQWALAMLRLLTALGIGLTIGALL